MKKNNKDHKPDYQCEKEGLENIAEKYRCKITVIKKEFKKELYQQYPYGAACGCGRLEEGEVFLTDNRWDPPTGLCHWAWSDLRPMIHSVHSGHDSAFISCCTDGLRPVTFKLERVER